MIITITPNQLTNSETVLQLLYDLGSECYTDLLQAYPCLKEVILELMVTPRVSEQIHLSQYTLSNEDTILHLKVKFLPQLEERTSTALLSKDIQSIKRKLMV
jgi:predicted glycosyl hydrolase (DUF1957 family)